MLKKIFSYGFVEGIAKGLNKFTVLLLPLFIDTISYGKVGLIISIEALLPLITLLGFDRAVLRFYSERKSFNSFLKSIFQPIIFTHLLLIIFLGIYFLLGFRTFFGIDLFPDLFLLIILVYFQGKNQINLNIFRVDEEHTKYFKARLFIQIAKFLLVIGLVYFTKSYLGYIIGAIVAAVAVNYLYSVKYDKELEQGFKRETFSKLFLFSWPFIFHGIASNFLGNADKFVIEKYLTMHDVGLYTLAYSLGTSMTFAFLGVSIFIEPLVYKQTNEKARENLLTKFTVLTLAIGVGVYAIIGIISQFVLPYFYAADYHEVFPYIPIIASGYLVFPFYFKANYRLIYDKKSKVIASISIVTSIINILLNILLIPIYGIFAGVVTTVFSIILQASSFLLLSNGLKINRETVNLWILSSLVLISLGLKVEYYYTLIPFILYVSYLYITDIKLRKTIQHE